jgi:hypothetical protein
MTTNEDIPLVYFDNVQVTHHRGQVLEEMHYFPFGPTIRSPNVNLLYIGGSLSERDNEYLLITFTDRLFTIKPHTMVISG